MSEEAVRVALVGAGAFGVKHLEAIRAIDGMEVAALVSGDPGQAREVAEKFGIPGIERTLDDVLARPDIDAVILCTPTPLHAPQAMACLRAGKHVEVEIPMADTLRDAEQLAELQRETGLVAMAGHTRRFNPGHQWVRRRVRAGEFRLQQMSVQTWFLRRTNTNALGEPRGWTDHLLWHHACHTVDLFEYQTGETVSEVHAMQGPLDPRLGIAMDMSIQLKVPSGALCTLALSFNNDGPFGSFFRYIGDTGTYLARYDELVDGYEKPIDLAGVDVSQNGIELQDRNFLAAIRDGAEAVSGVAAVLPAYRTLDRIERLLL